MQSQNLVAANAKIDLHTHSLYSDGTFWPKENLTRAKAAGLDLVALTDHDTTDGWGEARAAAQELGIGFIPGIEVTTKAKAASGISISIHLLAYLPDPDNEQLREALARSIESRTQRIYGMLELLRADYPHLTVEHLSSQQHGNKVLGRPALADAMIAAGYFTNRTQFFDICTKGSKYYLPTKGVPTTVEAIRLVREAGGVPVIAHPLARGKSGDGDGGDGGAVTSEPVVFPREHFIEMVEAGLGGIEIYHREVPAEIRETLIAFADEFFLIKTGSSDYHGHGKVNTLGENTTAPDQLQRILEQSTNPGLALLSNGH